MENIHLIRAKAKMLFVQYLSSMPSILADEMEYEDTKEYDSSDHELTISEFLEKGK
jgi:hypothetical protein